MIGSHARDRSWTSSWNKPSFARRWRRSCEANAAIPSRTGEIVAYLAAAALEMFEGAANPIPTVGKLLVGVDLDRGDVGLLVTADHLGRVPAVVLKDERHLGGVGDDVVVGYNVAGGGRATAAKGSGRNRYSRPRRAGPRSIPAEMPRSLSRANGRATICQELASIGPVMMHEAGPPRRAED